MLSNNMMNVLEIDIFGNRFWYKNGKLHREDGPVIEDASGNKFWHCNNKLHREDGPAIEFTNGQVEYWLNGVRYNSLEEGKMDQALR